MSAETEKKMMKPREFAAEYGIGANKTYELLRAGVLPHVRIGKSFLIPRKAAEAWIERQTIQVG